MYLNSSKNNLSNIRIKKRGGISYEKQENYYYTVGYNSYISNNTVILFGIM